MSPAPPAPAVCLLFLPACSHPSQQESTGFQADQLSALQDLTAGPGEAGKATTVPSSPECPPECTEVTPPGVRRSPLSRLKTGQTGQACPTPLISFQEMPAQKFIVHPGLDTRAESTNNYGHKRPKPPHMGLILHLSS